ncbi:hypothetical protein DZF79_04230 [Vibrio parahaemolyticus]|nr:hypothetical protein [Vibrio parahaemolyticus]
MNNAISKINPSVPFSHMHLIDNKDQYLKLAFAMGHGTVEQLEQVHIFVSKKEPDSDKLKVRLHKELVFPCIVWATKRSKGKEFTWIVNQGFSKANKSRTTQRPRANKIHHWKCEHSHH